VDSNTLVKMASIEEAAGVHHAFDMYLERLDDHVEHVRGELKVEVGMEYRYGHVHRGRISQGYLFRMVENLSQRETRARMNFKQVAGPHLGMFSLVRFPGEIRPEENTTAEPYEWVEVATMAQRQINYLSRCPQASVMCRIGEMLNCIDEEIKQMREYVQSLPTIQRVVTPTYSQPMVETKWNSPRRERLFPSVNAFFDRIKMVGLPPNNLAFAPQFYNFDRSNETQSREIWSNTYNSFQSTGVVDNRFFRRRHIQEREETQAHSRFNHQYRTEFRSLR
jgi:hypothetical protein